MEQRFEENKEWEADGGDAESDNGEEVVENPQEVLKECLEKFRTRDYIMEPGIFTQLKRYFQAGGNPEQVIELLSHNYNAVAQMANLLAEWLILAGVQVPDVQAMVENHLKDMILKTFDPKKADTIFNEEGETPAWLTEMIEHPTWRSLIYRLAEEYPDCLMLNFTIKLISDAGFQGEITSISTAAQQIEVFSRVLKTAITGFLQNTEDWYSSVEECAKMVCHGQHTYVYSQVLLQVLSQEPKGGSNMKRLSQEIIRCAQQNHHDVTPITMALNGASAYPQACQALTSMLSRNSLNPADITVLYRNYSAVDPPPIDLIRTPQFLDLLVDSLFKPGVKLNPEHKPKYIYLLAYAASVCETSTRKGQVRKNISKDELKPTIQAIEKVHGICNINKGSTELIAELSTFYHCIRFPVVSVGVVRWVESTVTEPSYFKLCVEHTPIHLALLDEVVSCHMLLHPMVLSLLVQLFESKQDELEILVQLEMRKMLLDRMVNLLCKGCVVPVVKYIKQCWQKGDTDISLIRYFVTEVLEAIAPPYTPEFVQLFLPMVENEEITGSMRGEGDNDPVSEFVDIFSGKYYKPSVTQEANDGIRNEAFNLKSVKPVFQDKKKAHFMVLLSCLHFLKNLVFNTVGFVPVNSCTGQFQAMKIMNEICRNKGYTLVKKMPVKYNITSDLRLSLFDFNFLNAMKSTAEFTTLFLIDIHEFYEKTLQICVTSKLNLKVKHPFSVLSNGNKTSTFSIYRKMNPVMNPDFWKNKTVDMNSGDETRNPKFRMYCGKRKMPVNKTARNKNSSNTIFCSFQHLSASLVDSPSYLHRVRENSSFKSWKQNTVKKEAVIQTLKCEFNKDLTLKSISKQTAVKLVKKLIEESQLKICNLIEAHLSKQTSKCSVDYKTELQKDLFTNREETNLKKYVSQEISGEIQEEIHEKSIVESCDMLALFEELEKVQKEKCSEDDRVDSLLREFSQHELKLEESEEQEDLIWIDPSRKDIIMWDGSHNCEAVDLYSCSANARMAYLCSVIDSSLDATTLRFEEFVKTYKEEDLTNPLLTDSPPSSCLPDEFVRDWDLKLNLFDGT